MDEDDDDDEEEEDDEDPAWFTVRSGLVSEVMLSHWTWPVRGLPVFTPKPRVKIAGWLPVEFGE